MLTNGAVFNTPFPHSTSVRSNNSTRARLGWTFSYICGIFVHPDLDLALLLVGIRERSIGSLKNKNSNYSDQSQRTQTIQSTNQNSKSIRIQVADEQRGKTCANDPRLVLVLRVIEWQNGTSFFGQSRSIVTQNQSNANYFQHSSDKRFYPKTKINPTIKFPNFLSLSDKKFSISMTRYLTDFVRQNMASWDGYGRKYM